MTPAPENRGSGISAVLGFTGFSAATFWALTHERRKEWYDILLDYSHHKRTRGLGVKGWEVVRRMVLRH